MRAVVPFLPIMRTRLIPTHDRQSTCSVIFPHILGVGAGTGWIQFETATFCYQKLKHFHTPNFFPARGGRERGEIFARDKFGMGGRGGANLRCRART